SDSVTGSLALPALSQTDVDTVTVIKSADSIVLARQSPTAWSANGHRAALDAVGEVFQALADTARPELVAQEPASFARLGVDSAAGRWLRLSRGGKPLLELIVGTRSTDFQGVYVRRPGDSHVYLWRGRLASVAVRPVRRLTVRGGRGVLLSLACDSGATGFIVRHLAGVGGEGSTVYRMNTWDVDGITPASRSLVPAKK